MACIGIGVSISGQTVCTGPGSCCSDETVAAAPHLRGDGFKTVVAQQILGRNTNGCAAHDPVVGFAGCTVGSVAGTINISRCLRSGVCYIGVDGSSGIVR